MTETPQNPPPGYYPDGKGAQRWWDGNAWTEHTQQQAAATAPPGPAAAIQPAYAQTPKHDDREWFKKKRFIIPAALVAVLVIGSIAGGGGGSDDANDTSASLASDESDSKDADDSSKSDEKDAAQEKADAEAKADAKKKADAKAKAKAKAKVIKVAAAEILKEFEQNEAAADLKYGDHKLLEVTGFVSKVDTELLHDDRYVINVSGPDYEYAFATVNCDGQSARDVAKIKVGQKITVGGDFQDGGDLGIELGGCHVV